MRIPGVPYVQGRNTYGTSTKYGIAIHNTSNDATAEEEASYATRRTDTVSAHLYVDNNSIVQSLDTTTRAGHAGSSTGNDHAVAVEITGVNGWTRAQWLDRVAWDKLGAALAHVVRKYGIQVRRASVAEMKTNPKVRAFYGHNDMRLAWGGTTHTDPGPNFPWDKLFGAVNAALGGTTGEDDDVTPEELMDHKVRSDALGGDFPVSSLLVQGLKAVRLLEGGQVAAGTNPGSGLVAQVAELASAVQELRTRPPAVIDYSALADAIVARLPESVLTKADVTAAARDAVADVLINGAGPAATAGPGSA